MFYVVLTALCAALLMLLLMPALLPILKKLKFGQTIYELGPKHQQKQGTPNMGGVLIGGIATVVTIVASATFYVVIGGIEGLAHEPFWSLQNRLFPLLLITLGSMAIGFADDYIKDVKKRHDGLSPKQKLVMQLGVGLLFSLYCYFYVGHDVLLPFTDKTWDLGLFYIPVMTLAVMFMTNSANLQDGLDGLLSTVTVIGMAAMGAIAICLSGMDGLSSYARAVLTAGCFSLLGACAGFLRFNHYPAKIFMGDTGSMYIGGMMVGVSMLTKTALPMILICFTSIMSSVSVMLQVGYFKLTHGKRLFKMSPIHHHFELCGMKETQIDLMYAAVTIVTCLIAIWSLLKFFYAA